MEWIEMVENGCGTLRFDGYNFNTTCTKPNTGQEDI